MILHRMRDLHLHCRCEEDQIQWRHGRCELAESPEFDERDVRQSRQVIQRRPKPAQPNPKPGEKQRHCATATTAMTHIALAEALDGKAVD